MPEINEEKIKELLNTLRGTTTDAKFKEYVEIVIKEDKEKAKIKAETDKKLLDKIKKANDKIKESEKKKEKETDDTDDEPPETPDRDDKGKFKKKEPDTPPEITDKDEAEIKKLTDQMEKMSKEIDALKKRKNYRTKPPKAEVVDEVDDFIKQNLTKDFEVVI